jgi:hypothetical protein
MTKKKQSKKSVPSSKRPGTEAEMTLPVRVGDAQYGLDLMLESSMMELEKMVGGRQELISALLTTAHPKALKFAKALGKSENGALSLYDVCRKVDSSPEELLSIFQRGQMVKGVVQSYMKLAEGLPGVVEESIRVARNGGSDGFKDRQMLMEISGMKGQNTGVTVNLNQDLRQFNSTDTGAFEKVMQGIGGAMDENPFIDVEIEES